MKPKDRFCLDAETITFYEHKKRNLMTTYYLVNQTTGSVRVLTIPESEPRPKRMGYTTYTNQAQAYAAAQRIAKKTA